MKYLENRDLFIKLRLSAKLFDTEAIFFKNFRNNKKYDTGQIKVVEYDGDKNVLLIKPSKELTAEFLNLKSFDLKVISDLKFLIQRIKAWYELNGANLLIPSNKSILKDTVNTIKFIPDNNFQPSPNQRQSLENLFTNPFSYIWGAPGTGKTQFVLSYAVLHYLHQNKKVAILAPTNNSIEQVLRGVIKMTDKAGIDRKQIIRLGTPSKRFADEFSEVCEEKGVQKKLDEIDKQISILERVVSYDIAVEQIRIRKLSLSLFDAFPQIFQNIAKTKNEYEKQRELSKKKEIDLKYKSDEIIKLENDKTKAEVKRKNIGYKIQKFFSSSETRLDNQIETLELKAIQASKDLDYLKYEHYVLTEDLERKKELFENSSNSFSESVLNLKKAFQGNENYLQLITEIEEKSWKDVKNKIEQRLENEKEAREIDSHLIREYKDYTIQYVQDELTAYITLRNKLAASSTEERLKTVQVTACTLDGYIGRYVESKLNVDHIFLDEAGYANIIKTLTVFNHTVPITLLGDHMQLPPVCEINDPDIQNDAEFKNMFLWAQSAIHLDHLFVDDRNHCLNQYLNNGPFSPVHIKKTSLNATYRFGDNLAKILARHVYNNDFTSLNPIGETQILFVDAQKREGLKSRVSSNEVNAIVDIVEGLKELNLGDFVILTPYKKQVKLLNNSLPKERNEIKILTVHGSQGREWDTVILSVVDTSDKFFVDSTLRISRGLNLVNTAVSRAKRQLIIVCDKGYWYNQNGQLITDLLKNGNEIKN